MNQGFYDSAVKFIKDLYQSDSVQLHTPVFLGKEKEYLNDCIDTTFVSSVGKYVDRFESGMADFTGAERAVAVVNGTNALMVALRLVGVEADTEVLTQPLTFVATCNAISYLSAYPVFADVDRDTLGLSPHSVAQFLEANAEKTAKGPWNKTTGKRISACLPMHTFGHPVRTRELVQLCKDWSLPVVEDAAESVGSYLGDVHTGLYGDLGVLSFNGNKTITTGGGGMILTNNTELADKAKYLTTTAKRPHQWEFFHDELAYNFRMPNINAALGCAQLEKLPEILADKRETAQEYLAFFQGKGDGNFFVERAGTRSNYWLNCVIMDSKADRDGFLEYSNQNGVMTRPVWRLMYHLPMYREAYRIETPNAQWLEDRIVNIPSGVRR